MQTTILLVSIGALLAVLMVIILIRREPRTKPTEIIPSAPDRENDSLSGTVLIGFASQSGFAEAIAWRTAIALGRQGKKSTIRDLHQLDCQTLMSHRTALFVVSTAGKGAPPDRALAFVRKIMTTKMSLQQMEFAVLALGNRDYDNFCAFGLKLHAWLLRCGARPIQDIIMVDNADDYTIRKWFTLMSGDAEALSSAVSSADQYQRWRLSGRHLLNAGSAEAPIFHITLTPLDLPPPWQAGDIVSIFPGSIADVFTRNANRRDREYSVASIPADGHLSLVVRRRYHSNNDMGLASLWLTEQANLTDIIALKIRSNPAFHPPSSDKPMILIGSGSGIAGLRSHLKARVIVEHRRNWLIFGERTARYDSLFKDEIDSWIDGGFIELLDLVFSRDQDHKLYVQDILRARGQILKKWIAQGASIYVCGSAEGMGMGVHESLLSVLGPTTLSQLQSKNRYRRDIY